MKLKLILPVAIAGDGWKQFGFKNQGQCIALVNDRP
jgi:hypothetical protein